MDKKILRNQMLKKRNSLNSDFVSSSELSAFEKLKSTNILNFKEILLYSSFKNEMPTKKIINYLLSEGRRVFLPKCDTDNLTFEAVEIFADDNNYQINKYGIYEPVQKFESKPFTIDCAIIPGVVFDKKCNRIGYGKGYYDKFLNLNSNVYKIGICYEFQVVNCIETSQYDVPMDMIITESSIYR